MSRSPESQKGQNILENNSRWCKQKHGVDWGKDFQTWSNLKMKRKQQIGDAKITVFFDTKAVQSKSRAILISEENPQTTKILGSSQKLKSRTALFPTQLQIHSSYPQINWN